MTDESAFLATLTDHAKAGNDAAYFAGLGQFADFLEEQGDSKASGVRWMFDNGKRPWREKHGDPRWVFFDIRGATDLDPESDIPTKFVLNMESHPRQQNDREDAMFFPTLELALAAFCLAYLAVQSAADELRRVREQMRTRTCHAFMFSCFEHSDRCHCDDGLGRREAAALAICGEPETEAATT